MKILAVNTANTILSLALVEGGKVLHLYETAETRDQGNLLLKHAQAALDAAKIGYSDLGLLTVVTGPGSFTGIRIGLATMRAIAMAANVPIVGISSFELFARPKPGHVNIICVESWREELYYQVIGTDGAELLPPLNLSPEDFVQKLASVPKPYVISGDAAAKLHAFLPDAVLDNTPASAATAAQLAARKGGKSERPVPFYLREADVTIAK